MSLVDTLRESSGWCPNAKAFMIHEPLKTDTAPENIPNGRDAGSLRVITPAMILLLPLLPALMFVGYTLMIPVLLPSTELQMAAKALLVGIPVVILLCYGRMTHDGIGTTLSGALLFPVFGIYSQILGLLFDPGFVLTLPGQWMNWNLFASITPFMLLLGVMGYLASRKTNGSLLIASIIGLLVISVVLGIR
jgi:hypothetical protein